MVAWTSSDVEFQSLMVGFDRASIESEHATVFGLWPDFTLAYVNSGWRQFSEQNGGEPVVSSQWPIRRSVLEAIATPLQPFYLDHYNRCLHEMRPWEHLYECSSAHLYREFHMMVLPLGDAEGLLVINSLRQESVHARAAYPPLDELYRDESGIATQCCHCRRVRRIDHTLAWDWVPDWVATQPHQVSHGLCPPCCGFHYSPERACEEFCEPIRTSAE